MSKHTPEPWRLYKKYSSGITAKPPKDWKSSKHHPNFIMAQVGLYVSISTEQADANAKRIVDCVNGLAGIKNIKVFMEKLRAQECESYRFVDCITNGVPQKYFCPRCLAVSAKQAVTT